MKKLLQIPISKALFELIQDYLLGRTQKVRVGDQLSNERAVTSGVPQGSVLVPLLFLIYMNDLLTVVFSLLASQIADDLKLIFNGRAEQESLEKLPINLQALHNWRVQNHLLFNLKKCSITTNTKKFDRIPFDPCNSIKRYDLCLFDQNNSTYLQPPRTKNRQLLPPWTSAGTSHHINVNKTERRKLRKKRTVYV